MSRPTWVAAAVVVSVLTVVSTAVTRVGEAADNKACPARHVCLWSEPGYSGTITAVAEADLTECLRLGAFRSLRNEGAAAVLASVSTDCSTAAPAYLVQYSGSVADLPASSSVLVSRCGEPWSVLLC